MSAMKNLSLTTVSAVCYRCFDSRHKKITISIDIFPNYIFSKRRLDGSVCVAKRIASYSRKILRARVNGRPIFSEKITLTAATLELQCNLG